MRQGIFKIRENNSPDRARRRKAPFIIDRSFLSIFSMRLSVFLKPSYRFSPILDVIEYSQKMLNT